MNDQNNSSTSATPSVQQQLGEISTIRDILMGGHIHQYEAEFNQIKQRIAQEHDETDQRIAALEQRIHERFEALEAQVNARFEALEAQMAAQVEQLHERISHVSKADKADLGRLLAEVSNRLING